MLPIASIVAERGSNKVIQRRRTSRSFGISFATGALVLAGLFAVPTAASAATQVKVGDGIASRAVAVDSSSGKIFVTNYASGTVSVIDPTSNTVIATIAVGAQPIAVAVDPVKGTVYVADSGDNTVSVIDEATGAVIATIPVGISPEGVSADPIQGTVYVTNSGSNNVSVIDETSNTVTATVNVGSDPIGIAVDHDAGKVYVTNFDSNDVSVMNETTHAITTVANVGASPVAVAVDHAAGKIYVANYNGHDVSVIDESTDTLAAPITVGSQPFGLAVDHDTGKVYVVDYTSDDVSIIDEATGTVTGTIAVGHLPDSVAISPSTAPAPAKLYVANYADANLSVIDLATDTVTDTVAIPGGGVSPVAVTLDSSDQTVYVADNTPDLWVIDAAGTLSGPYSSLGADPVLGIAADSASGHLYAISNSGQLLTIDAATMALIDSRAIGSGLTGVAVNPDTDTIYVSDISGHLTVIDGTSNTITATILVSGSLDGVAVDAGTNTLYATQANNVWVVDPTTQAVSGPIVVGADAITGIAVDASATRAYLTNAAGQLRAIDTTTNTLLPWSIAARSGLVGVAANPVAGTVDVISNVANDVATIDLTSLAEAPTGLTATAGVGEVTLTWNAPADTGGKSITGYAVTTTADGAPTSTVTHVGATPSATVTGLTGGTSYSFVVTAQTANGAGSPSTTVTAAPAVPPPAPAFAINRLAGAARDATAVKVSMAEYPAADSATAAVLARDDDFADALAGGPLAANVDAPLLLTPKNSLNPVTLDEIERVLAPGATVYFVGGNQALHANVETAVANAGFHVVRIEGATRAETAIAVAKRLGNPSTVFEVTGDNFPDGLAATPAAIRSNGAILFTDGDQQAPATAAYLSAHQSDVRCAVGGPATHADPNATPLSGADRYATDAVVAARFFANPAAAVVATGAKFPDALTGGVLAGSLGAPMLLAATAAPLPPSVRGYLAANGAHVVTIDVLGGTNAIDDSVVTALRAALGGET